MDYLISFRLEELLYRCHIDTVRLRIHLIVFRYWAMITVVGLASATSGITMLYTSYSVESSGIEPIMLWQWLCQIIGWGILICGILAIRNMLINRATHLSHLPDNVMRTTWTRLPFNWFESPTHYQFSHYDDSTIEDMPPSFNPSQCRRGEVYLLIDYQGKILYRIGDTEQFTDRHPT